MPEDNFCEEIIVWAQDNAWMMSELMEARLGCVWECLPGGLSKPWSRLTMDVFRDHLSDGIRNKLNYNHLMCQLTSHSSIMSINTIHLT